MEVNYKCLLDCVEMTALATGECSVCTIHSVSYQVFKTNQQCHAIKRVMFDFFVSDNQEEYMKMSAKLTALAPIDSMVGNNTRRTA